MGAWSDRAGVIAYAILVGFAVTEYQNQPVTCRLLFNQVSIIYFACETLTKILEILKPESVFTERMKVATFLLLWWMVAGYVRSYYRVPECMGTGFRDFLYWYVIPLFCLGIVAVVLTISYMVHLAYKHYQSDRFKREMTDFIKKGTNKPTILLSLYEEHKHKLQNLGLVPFELLCYKLNFSTQFGKALNQYESKDCSICFEEYCPESEAVGFPGCNHLFHFECLQNWLIKSPMCPCCKREFRVGFAQALIDKSQTHLLAEIDETQIVAYEKDLITQQPGLKDQMQQAANQIRNLENPLVQRELQLPPRPIVAARLADQLPDVMYQPLILRQVDRREQPLV